MPAPTRHLPRRLPTHCRRSSPQFPGPLLRTSWWYASALTPSVNPERRTYTMRETPCPERTKLGNQSQQEGGGSHLHQHHAIDGAGVRLSDLIPESELHGLATLFLHLLQRPPLHRAVPAAHQHCHRAPVPAPPPPINPAQLSSPTTTHRCPSTSRCVSSVGDPTHREIGSGAEQAMQVGVCSGCTSTLWRSTQSPIPSLPADHTLTASGVPASSSDPARARWDAVCRRARARRAQRGGGGQRSKRGRNPERQQVQRVRRREGGGRERGECGLNKGGGGSNRSLRDSRLHRRGGVGPRWCTTCCPRSGPRHVRVIGPCTRCPSFAAHADSLSLSLSDPPSLPPSCLSLSLSSYKHSLALSR